MERNLQHPPRNCRAHVKCLKLVLSRDQRTMSYRLVEAECLNVTLRAPGSANEAPALQVSRVAREGAVDLKGITDRGCHGYYFLACDASGETVARKGTG